jgi:hypothetical protein
MLRREFIRNVAGAGLLAAVPAVAKANVAERPPMIARNVRPVLGPNGLPVRVIATPCGRQAPWATDCMVIGYSEDAPDEFAYEDGSSESGYGWQMWFNQAGVGYVYGTRHDGSYPEKVVVWGDWDANGVPRRCGWYDPNTVVSFYGGHLDREAESNSGANS